MAKYQLTQTGAKVQEDLNLAENLFTAFSTSATYSVGDVVAYSGHLWKCIADVSVAGAWTGATNWEQKTVKDLLDTKQDTLVSGTNIKTVNGETLLGTTDISIPVVAINPADLADDDGEILGLAFGTGDNRVRYKAPSLSRTDGVAFAFGSSADFTFSDSYSSYNRCGNELTFVVACSIMKVNATTSPITLGTFTNIPSALFAKLVPTTVGGSDYLENCDIKAFDGAYSFVNASVAMTKGSNQDVVLTIETANMVLHTKYHVRYMVTFLLTDNLSSIDSVLSNNSWADIASVCEAGNAGSYWAIGDTKTDLGTDGNTRTQQILDMQGLYGKHVVFGQVELEPTSYRWNPSNNTDSDNAYNNYSISEMRMTHLPAILLKYSSDLQAVITNTTYKVATNGNNGTILDLTDKLFLPAMKEMWASPSYSRSEENSALTTFTYWTTHTSNADHIKNQSGNAYYWWSRSPISGYTYGVCCVYSGGSQDGGNANGSHGVSPCFSL